MASNTPFPIRTETSCLLKWSWNTIWLQRGATSSCHRNGHLKFSIDDFENFHNQPYFLDHRRSMLKGEWPHSPNHPGCSYCRKIEEAGGQSDRIFMTTTQTDQTPDELIDDPTAIHITPTIIEVFLSNTCNLMCTYCNVFNSSKIEAESKKYHSSHKEFNEKYFGNYEESLTTEEMNKYRDLLIDWLKRKGIKLRRFHILGGEPFYNRDFSKFIDVWNDYPNPNLILNVVSNVNVNYSSWTKSIDKICKLIETKSIEDFELTASLDCWGPAQEYVRHGFKCNLAEKNILYYLNRPTTKYLNINATHSIMSLPYYHLLLDKKKEWEEKTGKIIRLYGQPVRSDHVSLDILGGSFIKKSIKKILQSSNKNNWDDIQALRNFSGQIMPLINSPANTEKIKNFIEVYTELDRRRKTSWPSVYPEIAEEIEKYKNELV